MSIRCSYMFIDRDVFRVQTAKSKDIPKDEECTICRDKYKDPMKTVCNHFFCHLCLELWLKKHSFCPICIKDLKIRGSKEGLEGRIFFFIFPLPLGDLNFYRDLSNRNIVTEDDDELSYTFFYKRYYIVSTGNLHPNDPNLVAVRASLD